MPGAPAPWIELGVPPQFVFGSGGAGGPAQTVFADTGGAPQVNTTARTYDETLHYKLAGTIILALALVFVLQQLGFRFVIAAGVGS